MLTGAERLEGPGLERMLIGIRAGDPDDEVLVAWLAKESVRAVYLSENPADAELLLDKAIEGCRTDPVAEIKSLGRTVVRWRTEILAHHTTGASNGPTEGLNLLIKKVKRAGHGEPWKTPTHPAFGGSPQARPAADVSQARGGPSHRPESLESLARREGASDAYPPRHCEPSTGPNPLDGFRHVPLLGMISTVARCPGVTLAGARTPFRTYFPRTPFDRR